ncbi:aminotransferase [Leptospira perolatii]|uniref:alanine transaminase n=1 Tax=Leptospira perolatii TaxID=2023191 RepID=A0A2M9ZRQ7_9LEPT|nr:pyridoxal phosphate-dependent aminotransferase [Leptospira perolatii]PJZ71191.1 aminotransferase [Leptospira perolatii]PJZ74724.1 aminotransferase [Leptospira perolatii]
MTLKRYPAFSQKFDFQDGENDLYLKLKSLKESGDLIYDLTVSNPTQSKLTYPAEAIQHSLSQSESLVYEPDPKGLLLARDSIARYYEEKGISVSTEDLFLVSSSSEAISYLLKLFCDPDDEVLIPNPGYPLFEFLSIMENVVAQSYSLDEKRDWKINFPSLESKISKRTKLIFVVSPNNPTGSILEDDEFLRLKEIALSNGIAIVIDEVFSDYTQKGAVHRTYLDSDAPIFVINGISKLLALPQLKLSWILLSGTEDWKKEVKENLELVSDTFLSVNTPVQVALSELMHWRKMIQGQVQRRIDRNIQTAIDSLGSSHLISVLIPKAGWYLILQVSKYVSDEHFCQELLTEQKVLVHPGSMFGFDPKNCKIILCLLPEPEIFKEGILRLDSFLRSKS